MNGYTTRQAAAKIGISHISLTRYIAAKKIPAPKVQRFGGKFRVWTDEDIERVRKLLLKIKNGRKTRYQKQKNKPQSKTVPHKKKK